MGCIGLPGNTGPDDTTADLTTTERQAVHEVELGIEHLHRAHGQPMAFHPARGRAMDHLAEAKDRLRECGYPELADRLRDEFLPRSVLDAVGSDTPAELWTYELLERFRDDFLASFMAFGDAVGETVADGIGHPVEREQERVRTRRARRR